MGRQPCCDKIGLKRGPWTIEEDHRLMNFILNNGIQCWRLVPKLAGLMRCGKSCRLRWINYLRPDLKRGALTEAEEDMIIKLHSQLGNRIKKKLKFLGIDPLTHKPIEEINNDDIKQQVSEEINEKGMPEKTLEFTQEQQNSTSSSSINESNLEMFQNSHTLDMYYPGVEDLFQNWIASPIHNWDLFDNLQDNFL
ncbi:hypothetical protein H5410_064675 [Solanum commersonii]|uniref:Uncharacterized protein n=1 Tax=Solanum commersonii TaxID=4109 RepID=A0A9J5VZD8_SOLCO|nr:hypothetical protein H5410_064675 [Solanum commersonii]